jgi:hypothetical protein
MTKITMVLIKDNIKTMIYRKNLIEFNYQNLKKKI